MTDLQILFLLAGVAAIAFGLRRTGLHSRDSPREPEGTAGPDPWDLDSPLLPLGETGEWLLLGDATTGIQVFGATGSAKTTATGAQIVAPLLGLRDRGGVEAGGLVLCAKPGERELWEGYARVLGRSADVRLFGPGHPFKYNPFESEWKRPGAGAAVLTNILSMFTTLQEASTRGPSRGRDSEPFWEIERDKGMYNTIGAVAFATDGIRIDEMYRVITSAPATREEVEDPEWRGRSACWECIERARERPRTPTQERDYRTMRDYWLHEHPGLSDRTRSIVVSMLTGVLHKFNQGFMYELFSGETDLTPEACQDGRIIIVDMPIKEYNELGVLGGVLMKYMFQRVTERRDGRTSRRPVFLWADESHLFTTKYDSIFQSTARSSKCVTVYLTQSYNGYLDAYGGDHAKATVDSLLTNLRVKVFHSNDDMNGTNHYAAELFGKSLQSFEGGNVQLNAFDPAAPSRPPDGGGSANWSEHYEYDVQPYQFASGLATGGPANDWLADAWVYCGGRVFGSTGKPFVRASFRQWFEQGKAEGQFGRDP